MIRNQWFNHGWNLMYAGEFHWRLANCRAMSAGMNVFATDHPLVREPSPGFLRFQRRLLKGLLVLAIGYPLYLLLLGPLYALNGDGLFNFLPQVAREVWMLPAAPVYVIPGLRSSYDDYLNWWYDDPDAVPRETGWY